jgi:transcriptional regulator with XRE-family HTH domain
MNLGKTILELRKQKNVTQEDLAAELGVTAAAVSKWENGYTLPDVLMLCALADYFQVTTDELLGRNAKRKYAVVAAQTQALGQKIAALAQKHSIEVTHIATSFPEALSSLQENTGFILVSMTEPLTESQRRSAGESIHVLESQSAQEEYVLKGMEMFLEHLT